MVDGEKKSFKGIGLILLGFIAFYLIGFLYKQFMLESIALAVSFWVECCIRMQLSLSLVFLFCFNNQSNSLQKP